MKYIAAYYAWTITIEITNYTSCQLSSFVDGSYTLSLMANQLWKVHNRASLNQLKPKTFNGFTLNAGQQQV